MTRRCLRSTGNTPAKPPLMGPGSTVRAFQPEFTTQFRVYGPETASAWYDRIKRSWKHAAETLPRKKKAARRQDWYQAHRKTLDPWRELVIQRQTEHRNADSKNLEKARKRLKHARRRYRQEAKEAKEAYTLSFLMGLNPHDMGSLFKAAKSLAEGLGQRRTAPPRSGAVSREKIKSHFQDIWTINELLTGSQQCST